MTGTLMPVSIYVHCDSSWLVAHPAQQKENTRLLAVQLVAAQFPTCCMAVRVHFDAMNIQHGRCPPGLPSMHSTESGSYRSPHCCHSLPCCYT